MRRKHRLTFKSVNDGTYYHCTCGWSQGWIQGDRAAAKRMNKAAHQCRPPDYPPPGVCRSLRAALDLGPGDPTMSDRFDEWLDKRPRLDKIYTTWIIYKPRPIRRVKNALRDRQARREWVPGTFYLDHGWTPCVLVRLWDNDSVLEGVSLVDGRMLGGCDIYACGPERISKAEARKVAEVLKKMKSS